MPFTRKFLSALGIEADKVDEIINAHVEVVDAIKEERDTYKVSADKLPEAERLLAEANEKLTKNGGAEMVSKEDFDKLKNEYDAYKADIVAKNTRTEKENAFRELLKSVGVNEKRINSVLKVSDIEKIELDENKAIKNAAELTESIKNEWSDFIETTTERGANTANPPENMGNGSGKTKEEILAIKDGALRREEMAKNPHLFGLDTK